MTPCSPAKRVCSNSAGKNPDNFFYNICNDPSYGFQEYHATAMENPLLPKRAAKESFEAWLKRQAQFRADLVKDNDPLVYSQEYMAEFVDWSGAAFFSRDKLLFDGQPLPCPRGATGSSPLSTPPQGPEPRTMRRPSFSSRPIPSG